MQKKDITPFLKLALKKSFESISEDFEKEFTSLTNNIEEMILSFFDKFHSDIEEKSLFLQHLKDMLPQLRESEEKTHISTIKSAFRQIGMPYELASTKEGKDFMSKYNSGYFLTKDEKGNEKFDRQLLSNVSEYGRLSEEDLNELRLKHSNPQRKSFQLEFINNLLENTIPDIHEQKEKSKSNLEKKNNKNILILDEYQKYVELDAENVLYLVWNNGKYKQDKAAKQVIKEKNKEYQNFPISGKLEILKKLDNVCTDIVTEFKSNGYLDSEIKRREKLVIEYPNNDKVQKSLNVLKSENHFQIASSLITTKTLSENASIKYASNRIQQFDKKDTKPAKKPKNTKPKEKKPKIQKQQKYFF